MAKRERVKKGLIILVIVIFLIVTFGTFVAYLVGGNKTQQPIDTNEVQPTTIETGDDAVTKTGISVQVDSTVKTGAVTSTGN